jgi:folate-binding protein YgfZ
MFSVDQYAAAHTSAVMFERSDQGTVSVAGADRASFLHALLTNDIARLTAGTGTYAAYLTPQGRMISDMRLIETGSRMLVGVQRDIAGAIAERLDKLVFSEDVQVKDATSEVELVSVYGPSAASMIQRATGISVLDLANRYDNLTSDSINVVKDDSLGVPGFDIYVPSGDGAGLRKRLADAGVSPGSDETSETLRIEAGVPRFGIDMTADTIPLEAGIEDRAISFTKGCYVGQEVIVRVMHRGHGRVARRLVSLVLPSGRTPAHGDAIFAGDRQVGNVTSAADSPRLEAALALGYVQRDFAAPGTELLVNGSEARVYQPVD